MRHRRALLWGTAISVIMAVAAVAVVLLRPAGPAAAAPQDRPGPVLLVPGYGGSTAALQVLATRLEAAGRAAAVVQVPAGGMGDLRDSARALDAAADRALADGAPSVDVVGYSAGGVIARLWAKDDGAGAVRRVVTLGAPHHGSQVAGLGAAFAPNLCPVACQQLVPGSDLLAALNENDETPAGPAYLSLWTDVDEVVTPPTSARLEGAVNVSVQQLCPSSRVQHGMLPRDPTVTRVVLAALSAAPLQAPAPGCSG